MVSTVPENLLIYHILHYDKLSSVVADGFLWSDSESRRRCSPGTTVGMQDIKTKRLTKELQSHPGLHVGECVPFYFCPRSVMLYLLHRGNHPNLQYRDGQQPLIHLEADFDKAVEWAEAKRKRWAFTTSNAGSGYFEDICDKRSLSEINWTAVAARQWSGSGIDPALKDQKQAEYLTETCFPWELVERIGVISQAAAVKVQQALSGSMHRPLLEIHPEWYY